MYLPEHFDRKLFRTYENLHNAPENIRKLSAKEKTRYFYYELRPKYFIRSPTDYFILFRNNNNNNNKPDESIISIVIFYVFVQVVNTNGMINKNRVEKKTKNK